MNKKFIIAVVLMAMTGCTNKRVEDFPEIVQIEKPIPYHIVRDGDTVGNIAEKYSMTRSELIKLNSLTPPYQLYNGQRLVVNIKTEDTAADKDIVATETTTEKIDHTDHQPQEKGDYLKVEEDAITPERPRTPDTTVAPAKAEDNSDNGDAFMWPVADGKLKIVQTFAESSDGGTIIKTSAGTVVKAIADGIVRIAKALDGDASSYGKTVIIMHNKQRKLSVSSHLLEISVKEGQKVKKGTIIGKVGKSGTAKFPQLFFQVFSIGENEKRTSIDPADILP